MTPEDRLAAAARERSARLYQALLNGAEQWRKADEKVRDAVEGFASFAELDAAQKRRSAAIADLENLLDLMK